MDSHLEKQFRERTVELGNSGDPSALPELSELLRSPADYKIGMLKKQ
ncbi:MAG: hypothetical protein KAH99_04040 [Verrucomicrobia bacterium]|nr:hypothetical protein [Verrucomicrobiota bacterium]